jgi:hypothetical protein
MSTVAITRYVCLSVCFDSSWVLKESHNTSSLSSLSFPLFVCQIYRGGDPSNAHSTATVRVVRQRTIAARDLISFSRVQNQVAKSAVLAYLDPQTKEAKFVVVNFQSVSDRA